MKNRPVFSIILALILGFWASNARAQLGSLPTLNVTFQNITVTNGGSANLGIIASSLTALQFQWAKNGTNITGWLTSSNLALTNVSPSDAGTYSVSVKNAIATISVDVAAIIVKYVSMNPTNCGMTSNGFLLKLAGTSNSNAVIEATSDMKSWKAISTNTLTGGTCSFLDTAAKSNSVRFYRVYIK